MILQVESIHIGHNEQAWGAQMSKVELSCLEKPQREAALQD